MRSFVQQYDTSRFDKNSAIKTQGEILYVLEIVFQLDVRLLFSGRVAITDLCPSRDSRPHRVAQVVIGNFVSKFLYEDRPLRTWSHQTHFPLPHVDQLRKLIESQFS